MKPCSHFGTREFHGRSLSVFIKMFELGGILHVPSHCWVGEGGVRTSDGAGSMVLLLLYFPMEISAFLSYQVFFVLDSSSSIGSSILYPIDSVFNDILIY